MPMARAGLRPSVRNENLRRVLDIRSCDIERSDDTCIDPQGVVDEGSLFACHNKDEEGKDEGAEDLSAKLLEHLSNTNALHDWSSDVIDENPC